MTWAHFRWWLAGKISPEMKGLSVPGHYAQIQKNLLHNVMEQISGQTGITDAQRGVPTSALTATEAKTPLKTAILSHPPLCAVPTCSNYKHGYSALCLYHLTSDVDCGYCPTTGEKKPLSEHVWYPPDG